MAGGPRRSIEERFWEKVDRSNINGCWLWLAHKEKNGYGTFSRGARGMGSIFAHRFVYELLVGPIPEGLTIDHLCKNTSCVNPAHLEPVTMRENLLRSNGFPAKNAAKTHCPHGHPYSGENLEYSKLPKGRWCRVCKTCKKAKFRRWYENNRRVPNASSDLLQGVNG